MATVNKSVPENWHIRTLTYRFTDALAIIAGWMLATRALDPLTDQYHSLVVTLTILLYHIVGEITGLYRNWRGTAINAEIGCAVATWLVATPILVAGSFAVGGVGSLDPPFFANWMVLTVVFAVLTRALLRMTQEVLHQWGLNSRGYAIVGTGDIAIQLAQAINTSPEMGLKLVGFFDDRDEERTPPIDPRVGQLTGDVNDLADRVRRGEVATVYITLPMRAEDRIRHILEQLADSTASVYLIPDFFVFQPIHSRWTNIGGLPAVSAFENPFYGFDGLVKRMLDIVGASVLLLALAVPMILIGLAVKFSSPGPIFFKQRRYGLRGREILVWKFRSMTVCENGDKVTQATRDDIRITPIGSILRKTSLDELPQLFNVLNGTMSLVGPRPHASAHNEEYRTQILGYMLRHKVRPGITGLAQVNGHRGETDTLEKMERRIECDHQYIREWSLLLDVKILLKTIFVVFSRQNAY